jgi:hypothetical protein
MYIPVQSTLMEVIFLIHKLLDIYALRRYNAYIRIGKGKVTWEEFIKP